MSDKNENLEDIFSGFLNAEDAARAADDIRQGEQLLEQFDAPAPDEQLLEQINVQIAAKLASRATSGVRWTSRSAVAAVAVVLISLATVLLMPGPTDFRDPGDQWWEGAAVKSVSTDKSLSAEMDDLLEQMITISREEYYFEDDDSVFDETEIEEIEMIATSDDFWKG